jgi:sodium-coupled neutral amino acid transporter 11
MFFTYPMESFVARHVLVQLWYNGDMDGNTEGPDGKVIPEQKLFGFMGRRVRVSALLYITTLLPALYIDDLGPVLSLTGSLGASCIAYIGPGLVYFVINGDDFLSLCAILLEEAGYKEKTAGANMELPIAGDAQAPLATPMKDPLVGPKPWWWWPMGFPIWVAIARTGARGTRNFLSVLDEDCGEPSPPPGAPPLPSSEEIVGPIRKDYYIAMVQITFGTVAMVVGVASNIYVEVCKGKKQLCFPFCCRNSQCSFLLPCS